MTKNIFFDEEKWSKVMTNNQDWYSVLNPEFEAILKGNERRSPETRKAYGNAVYGFVERFLSEGKVMLGNTGKNWDAERMPIDTIVIHHTKGESGITWQKLNAIHLLRLYASTYHSPLTEKEIKGLPIYSHHFRDDAKTHMVFYAYHWLVRADGTAEGLLADDEIGWHAGNWAINCRSVAICLDGDFEHSTPPDAMIEGVRKIIINHYAQVAIKNIIPHSNANPKTTCPGEWFEGVIWK